MSHVQNETMDRGYIGLLPRPTKLADESYLEYVQSFRKMIIQDMFPVVAAGGEARYAVWKTEHKPNANSCLLYTSPSPRDQRGSRMPSSA